MATLTQEEKDELIQEVINVITTQSTSIDSLDVADSLEDTESLPAYKAGSSELLRVPINLLYGPVKAATDAATVATNAANVATQEAEAATTRANDAANYTVGVGTSVEAQLENINNIESTANNAYDMAMAQNTQLGGLSLMATTEEDYGNLETKDENTLYLCTEE